MGVCKRYDSMGVRASGGGTGIRFREGTEGGGESIVRQTRANYSMRLYHDSSNIIDIIRTGAVRC